MATRILDDDIMVLQKKGNFNLADDFYEDKFPGSGVKIDTEIFHYTGADLRHSVTEFVDEANRFVRVSGDEMTGNLKISVPAEGDVEGAPYLRMQGYQTTPNEPYAHIKFINRAHTSGKAISIKVRGGKDDGTIPYRFEMAGHVDIDNSGRVNLHGTKNHVCVRDGKEGFLTINPTNDYTYADEGKRLEWSEPGGNLWNGDEKLILGWGRLGGRLVGDDDLVLWSGDTAHYVGAITEDDSLVTKEYVNDEDDLRLPLAGENAPGGRDGATMTGTVHFEANAALNGLPAGALKLQQNYTDYITIGGNSANVIDDKVHLYSEIHCHDNKVSNVKYPNVTPGDHESDNDAVPKKYIDEQDQLLHDAIGLLTDIATPPGMINAWPGTTAPPGWLLCDGTEYHSDTYPKMHAALGRSGTGNYKTPDLKGRFLVQYGDFGAGNSVMANLSHKTAKPASFVATVDLKHNHTWSYSNNANGKNNTDNPGDHKHKYGSNSNFAAPSAGSAGAKAWIAGNHANTTDAGGHIHNVYLDISGTTANSLSNSTNLSVYGWDQFSRPYAYTINWIIKHDN